MNTRSRWLLGLSAVVGVATAALVVFAGLQSGSGDRILSPGAEPAQTAVIGNPGYFYATILPPQEHEGNFPVTVSIGSDERIPYDPAALLERIRSVDPPYTWRVAYDDDPIVGEQSTVQFDSEGKVLVQRILPWHAAVFEPLITLGGGTLQLRTDVSARPSPTNEPAPTPKVVTIRGVEVALPPGARISSVTVDCLTYCGGGDPQIITLGESFITFNDYGIAGEQIRPEDAAELGPVLDKLRTVEWDPAP